MDDSKKILKTIKVIIICSIAFVIILVIYHLVINGVPKKKEIVDTLDYKLTIVNEKYENPKYCNPYYFVEESDNNQKNTLILNNNLELIETITLPIDNVYCLYDGYYLLKNNDNITLKRNGSIVSGVSSNHDSLYKDESDATSNYVSYEYINNLVNNEITKLEGNYAYANNMLINIITGDILDNAIIYFKEVKIANETKYWYIKNNLHSYLFDYTNGNILLLDQNLILNEENDYLTNNSLYNFLYKTDDEMGIININNKIIMKGSNGEINLDSDNVNYFAIKKDDNYGLINSFGNVVFDYNYNLIIVKDEYIFTIKDNNLDIYDIELKKLNAESYKINDSDFKITEYPEFYQVKGLNDGNNEELVITKNTDQLNALMGIREIKYCNLFYSDNCYLVNENGSFKIYFKDGSSYILINNFRNNVENAIMIDANYLYYDYHAYNKAKYGFFRIKSGILLDAYSKDELDQEFETFKINNLVFARHNNKVSIYYKNTLYDEFEAKKVIHLNNEYYSIETENKREFVKIEQYSKN